MALTVNGKAALAIKGRSLIIYDARCSICSRTIAWVEKQAEKNSLETLACQGEAFRERFPSLTRERCMRAVQVVLPDGRVFEGEKALPFILKKMPRYRLLAILFKVPGVTLASRIVYALFARVRHPIARLLYKSQSKHE